MRSQATFSQLSAFIASTQNPGPENDETTDEQWRLAGLTGPPGDQKRAAPGIARGNR
jgi:hypothetical protein